MFLILLEIYLFLVVFDYQCHNQTCLIFLTDYFILLTEIEGRLFEKKCKLSWCPLKAPISGEILRPGRGTSEKYFCEMGVTKRTCLFSFQYSFNGEGVKLKKYQKR